jgi:hypothetical protein
LSPNTFNPESSMKRFTLFAAVAAVAVILAFVFFVKPLGNASAQAPVAARTIVANTNPTTNATPITPAQYHAQRIAQQQAAAAQQRIIGLQRAQIRNAQQQEAQQRFLNYRWALQQQRLANGQP